MLKLINKLIKQSLLFIIKLYQKTLSPDSGWFKVYYPHGYCPYHPHCSAYCYQAIAKHGPYQGLRQGLWRIIRCHPFTKGGYDPVK